MATTTRRGLFFFFVLALIPALFSSNAVAAAPASKKPAAHAKPNVLFIFADDQCFQTLRCLGNDEIKTPNLDRLAKRGMLFTHAYNQGAWCGAVCVSSRSMLNTGRFLWNAKRVHDASNSQHAATRLWAEYMQQAGYETYMTGKWHVHANAKKVFQHTVHIRGGMPRQTKKGYNRPLADKPDPWSPYNKKLGGYWKDGKHWSEVLGDDATEFLAKAAKSDKPFFMYLAFNAAHDPRQSPKKYVDMYPLEKISLPKNFLPEYPYKEAMKCGKKLRDERLAPFPRTPHAVKVHRQEYYAIITHMDAQIGRILDALEKSGKADNTYIFFTADHGLAVGQHGLMGKQNMFDHSVRVPLIVVGPGIKKETRTDIPIYLQDIMPTTLELAGVKKPKQVQFHSLVPLMKEQTNASPYNAIYGAYLDRQRMITAGDYKLILYPSIHKALLFNLRTDPQEMHDLATKKESRPIIKKLFVQLHKLQAETGDTLNLEKAYPQYTPK